MLDTSTPCVQVLPPLTNGSIVRVVSDGSIGELTWHSSTTAYVVHGDRPLGRGPWILHPTQLVPATPSERLGYWERYESLLIVQGATEGQLAIVRKLAAEARMEVR